LDEAIREYETALSKNPKLVPAHMMIGMIYESRKQYDQAQARYQEAVRINPRFAPAANNLAWLMMEHGGNLDVALGYAQTAREVMPTDPNVADTLGWIYYQKKVYLKAVSLLKEAAEQLHENPVVLYHYGMAQYRNENKSEARKALEKSLQLNANHPGAAEAKATLAALSLPS
jgi:tetratricopeptide (TPR) repeat protein